MPAKGSEASRPPAEKAERDPLQDLEQADLSSKQWEAIRDLAERRRQEAIEREFKESFPEPIDIAKVEERDNRPLAEIAQRLLDQEILHMKGEKLDAVIDAISASDREDWVNFETPPSEIAEKHERGLRITFEDKEREQVITFTITEDQTRGGEKAYRIKANVYGPATPQKWQTEHYPPRTQKEEHLGMNFRDFLYAEDLGRDGGPERFWKIHSFYTGESYEEDY